MFNLSIKQHFWINAILGVIFAYMFLVGFKHLDFISIVLNGVFAYLTLGAVYQRHWQPRDYPFNKKMFRRKVVNNAKRW